MEEAQTECLTERDGEGRQKYREMRTKQEICLCKNETAEADFLTD